MRSGTSFVGSMRYVILPQAVRNAVPALVNHTVSLFKNTSLAMAIGVAELTHVVREVDSRSFRTFEVYAVGTALYLVFSLLLMGPRRHSVPPLSLGHEPLMAAVFEHPARQLAVTAGRSVSIRAAGRDRSDAGAVRARDRAGFSAQRAVGAGSAVALRRVSLACHCVGLCHPRRPRC